MIGQTYRCSVNSFELKCSAKGSLYDFPPKVEKYTDEFVRLSVRLCKNSVTLSICHYAPSK